MTHFNASFRLLFKRIHFEIIFEVTFGKLQFDEK